MHGIERKTLLRESDVEWTDYAINHYKGCPHGCVYCYAKSQIHDVYWRKRWGEFHDVKPVSNALELLEKDLRKQKPGRVLLCSMCDPYPAKIEKRLELTRRLLERLLNTPLHVLILTKSSFAKRDLDIMESHDNVELGVTLTSLTAEDAKCYEPLTSPPEDRISVLKEAHKRGIKTFMSIEPWIPEVTDPWKIVQQCRDFVDFFIIGALNYRSVPHGYYQRELPELVKKLDKAGVKYMLKRELLQKAGMEKGEASLSGGDGA
jgi:DNA repair photolyase